LLSPRGEATTETLKARKFNVPISVIQDYVASCPVCQAVKLDRKKPAGLLNPLPAPEAPMLSVTMDLVSGFAGLDKNRYIMVAVDRFSKYLFLSSFDKAPTGNQLFATLCSKFEKTGFPAELITDRAPQFRSPVWSANWASRGVKVKLASTYHPQTDGQSERTIQTVLGYLRVACFKNELRWEAVLVLILHAYNSQVHSATGYAPDYVLNINNCHGRTEVESSLLCQRVRSTLSLKAAAMKLSADKSRREGDTYLVGNLVYLNSKNFLLRGVGNKLQPRFLGPFRVKKLLGSVAVKLELPAIYARRSHTFNRDLLKLAVLRNWVQEPVTAL
jgi:hypothetical protein